MANCINVNHPDFIRLEMKSGLDGMELSSRMMNWMAENNTNEWPTLEQLGIESKSNIKKGVSELFESNPELANNVYEALGFNTINESEITYTDEDGNLCAKDGGRGNKFTKGSKWKIVKDLKGYPSHAQGGVDIKIGKDGFSFRGKDAYIKAAHGLLLANINN